MRNRRRLPAAFALALALAWPAAPALSQADAPQANAPQANDAAALENALALLSPDAGRRTAALAWIRARGTPDMAAALIQLQRFWRDDAVLDALLSDITGPQEGGEDLHGWRAWMLWQEGHPEIAPFAGFDSFKAVVLQQIDPNFAAFLGPGVAHEIRLEEIVWGGVAKDGIPALTDPELIAPAEADYLNEDELVFGVKIAGDARAYPLRIMDWHEMFNDVIGGVPVSLAYCTLCGSGILFETKVEGRAGDLGGPFVFGSSGLLYRSNKLMYDRATNSLWNQFTGRPVVGPLTGSGIALKTRPVTITSWAAWRTANPDTRVLSLDTGYRRDYRPGQPYGDYFASPALMFPTRVDETQLQAKDYVFALRSSGTEKAWPLSHFEGGQVINDRAGVLDLVLVGDAATRSVRAYRSGGRTFEQGPNADTGLATLTSNGETWQLTEEALLGPAGESLPRLPGHIAYWFAWSGYLGAEGELAGE
jgi:hypothetical protein